ncbi:MAG: hypothetical protein GY864_02030 [Desulfobacterales bacterium]|nr:hypothetical protein [Desulfobacterales bacterium]
MDELSDKDAVFTLDQRLLRDILSGKRKRKLKNITVKIDPLHIMAIKKFATMKSVPYQTLIRQWLAENIRKELASQSISENRT